MNKEDIVHVLKHPVFSIVFPILLSILCVFYIASNMFYMHGGMQSVALAQHTELEVYEMRNEIIEITGGGFAGAEEEAVAVSHIIMLEPSLVSVSR